MRGQEEISESSGRNAKLGKILPKASGVYTYERKKLVKRMRWSMMALAAGGPLIRTDRRALIKVQWEDRWWNELKRGAYGAGKQSSKAEIVHCPQFQHDSIGEDREKRAPVPKVIGDRNQDGA